MRRAQRLTISVFGIVVGIAGLEHGIGEIAQGGTVLATARAERSRSRWRRVPRP